jgi:hypothetical protein
VPITGNVGTVGTIVPTMVAAAQMAADAFRMENVKESETPTSIIVMAATPAQGGNIALMGADAHLVDQLNAATAKRFVSPVQNAQVAAAALQKVRMIAEMEGIARPEVIAFQEAAARKWALYCVKNKTVVATMSAPQIHIV